MDGSALLAGKAHSKSVYSGAASTMGMSLWPFEVIAEAVKPEVKLGVC